MLAGYFVATLIAAQPGYMDSGVCAGCHAYIAKNYARTRNGSFVRTVSKTAAEREFDGSTFFHAPSRELLAFTLRDGIRWIRRSQPGPGRAETAGAHNNLASHSTRAGSKTKQFHT
jgi:hypothetical protein